MRTLFLAATLITATALSTSPAKPSGALSAHLRGVSTADPAAKKQQPMLNSNFTDERGPRGHFYYAKSCGDCFYKGAGCGCEPAMEYFACLTKHCYKSDSRLFAERCTELGDKCYRELDINCRGPDSVCQSKMSQLPRGGLGFTMDVDEDNAFCGPHGKCIGKIGLTVHLQNAPKEEPKAPKVPVGSPAPGPAAASPAAAAPKEEDKEEEEIWLECGLPKGDYADIDRREDWILCEKKVEGDHETCKMPMFKELKAGASKKAYCVLTEGEGGRRLTEHHWTQVLNVHEDRDYTVEKKQDEKKAKTEKEMKKVKPAKEAAPEKKVEKAAKPEKKEAKPAAKPAEEEKLVAGNTQKLPWMVEKEKRQAARAAEEADAAKEPKEPEKKEEEKAPEGRPSDSQLPWMKGKMNDKAPPPHEQVR